MSIIQAPQSYPGGPCMRDARHSQRCVNPAIICDAGVRNDTWVLAPTNRGFSVRYIVEKKTLGTLGARAEEQRAFWFGPVGYPHGVWAVGRGRKKSKHEHPVFCISFLCSARSANTRRTRPPTSLLDHNHIPHPFDIYRRSTYQSCSRLSALLAALLP